MPRRSQTMPSAILLVGALLTLGCNPKRPVQTHPPPSQWPAPVEHVIIVTIDGLRVDMIDDENAPNLMRMVEEGAYTLAAQTVVPSLTLPAHSSLVTGLTPDQHHVKWNSYRPHMGNLAALTIFDIARENGMTTAIFSGKEKLRHIAQPGDVDMCSIEKRADLAVMSDAIKHLYSQQPNLMLIHLPGVDRAGHFAGWKSHKQAQVLQEVDRSLGRLLESIENLEMRHSTVVIVTADHGGEGRHHSAKDTDIRTIPWIVWGGAIEPHEIHPVSITATANTAVRLLGIELPEEWAAREARSD